MTALRVAVLILVVALTAMGQQNPGQQRREWPASCPVTVSAELPFMPPPPYEMDTESGFWLGTDKLWTGLLKSGTVWGWAPREPGHEQDVQPLTAKTFWGSVDFDWKVEYPVNIKVTGKRLDGDAPPLLASRGTNAFPGPAAAMLVGIYVPTLGCWEITGEYKGTKLSYVVWVKPAKHIK